jgi:hypothetical protein
MRHFVKVSGIGRIQLEESLNIAFLGYFHTIAAQSTTKNSGLAFQNSVKTIKEVLKVDDALENAFLMQYFVYS